MFVKILFAGQTIPCKAEASRQPSRVQRLLANFEALPVNVRVNPGAIRRSGYAGAPRFLVWRMSESINQKHPPSKQRLRFKSSRLQCCANAIRGFRENGSCPCCFSPLRPTCFFPHIPVLRCSSRPAVVSVKSHFTDGCSKSRPGSFFRPG